MEEINRAYSEKTKTTLKRILLGVTFFHCAILLFGVITFFISGDETISKFIAFSVIIILGYSFISPLIFLVFIIIFVKYRKCKFVSNQEILIICNSAFFIITTLFTVFMIILTAKYPD